MVELLIGRAGAGKSQAVLERMTAAHRARRQILIVPEQYSHRAERRVCAVGGNPLSLGAEVLTFTRLATRVFAQAGGLAAPTLDDGGRLLVMYLAVKEVSEGLSVYRRPSRKSAFLTGLLNTLDECKSYRADPAALARAGGELGGTTGEKLHDLGLIFTAYDRLCGELGADPRDRLTRLAEALKTSRWAAGTDVYLDGFTDFTPQQGLVLSALMEQANSVTVALTCDHLLEDEDGLGIFSPARKTAAYLKRLAKDAGQTVQVETVARTKGDKSPALTYLEANLFADHAAPWEGERGVICAAPDDPRKEVEWVCAEILRLVRMEGCRFREIAVTARTLEGYEALIDDTFPRFGIPVFLARTQDILEKPVLALITSALAAVSGGYRYEDLFRYLKTGLAGVEDDQRDRLENYVLTWDIKGGRWTADKPWHMHPDGYGREFTEGDEARLAALDGLRRRIIAPLERLRTAPGSTGRDRAMALYAFLEEIRLPETLAGRVETLKEREELNLAEEYKQLWDILVGALETCARLLRDVEMDMEEFARLFVLTLSQYQVGTIPVALDRVTAGPCPRLGYESYKAVFFLGCDDAHLPQCAPSPGLLTDDDRFALEQVGLSLAPRMEDKLCREMTIAYNACTLPTQKLFVTYPAVADGEEQRGSFLLHRLTALFPGAWAEPGQDPRLAAAETALELAGEHEEVRRALEGIEGLEGALARLKRGNAGNRHALSRSGVAALYGKRVPMSASRLDLYRSCHFSYFMRYGLDAKPRRRAGFDAPEYGTFVHAVLEEVLRGWDKSMDEETVHDLTRRAMERYLNEELGGLEDKTPRFAYLFRRLGRTVERVVDNVTAELSRSDFQPIAFELGFGTNKDMPPVELEVDGVKVSVSGFVDRVDGWEHDGKLYLRVVDYKTGQKSFDLTDIFYGIGLQMLLYLFTLEQRGKEYFGKDVVGAGVLYVPAREALVSGSRDMDEGLRRKAADKELRRRGLLLEDETVLAAMAGTEDMERFLPVKVKKDGAFSGDSLASLEQLGKLRAHVDRILEEVGRELAAGTVAADPYWRGAEENACRWCPYAAACQFEEGKGGDCRRWGHKLKAEDFWSALEGGEGDGLSADR